MEMQSKTEQNSRSTFTIVLTTVIVLLAVIPIEILLIFIWAARVLLGIQLDLTDPRLSEIRRLPRIQK